MWPELNDKALELDEEVATFADLLLVGLATGLVEDAMTSTQRGLRAVEETDLEPPHAEVIAAARAFRRARRLESGEDLRAWLAARQVTMDEWEAHLRRCIAGQRLPEAATDPPLDGAIGLECRAFVVDLACGGWWQRFADVSTRYWAAARLLGHEPNVADSDHPDEPNRILAAFQPLTALGEKWRSEGLSRIRARKHALEELAARYAEEDIVARRVLEHAVKWTELRYDELVLPTREAANEAVLCARDDAIEAAELAARAGLTLAQRACRHDSLPIAVASLLDGAPPDQPIGPIAVDEQWSVFWLRERRRPSREDDATSAAASADLLDEALERATRGLVRRTGPL